MAVSIDFLPPFKNINAVGREFSISICHKANCYNLKASTFYNLYSHKEVLTNYFLKKYEGLINI